MWVLFAFGSAFFAGVTAILAKCGVKKTDSDVATAIRTVVVLIFSWIMALLAGSVGSIVSVSAESWAFLILSGLATGASWICYFRALQLGDINKVVPVDKSGTALTMLLAVIFLRERMTWIKAAAMIAITAGTYMTIQKKQVEGETKKSGAWLIYALLSTVFASLTSILGKAGLKGVEANLGTAIRTCVVLAMAWLIVFATGKRRALASVPKNELGFVCLSGLATGASWLCYYKALKDGPASVVVPVDKLSILVTVAFSFLVFGERLTKRAAAGLALIVAGTLALLI